MSILDKMQQNLLLIVVVIGIIAAASVFIVSSDQPKQNAGGPTSISITTSILQLQTSTILQTSVQSTTSSITSSATTTIASNLTDNYIMTFLACTGTGCSDPQSHMTYLAQSNDGSNWSLVSGFTPYRGSVPDLVKRGSVIYIYNPGMVTTFNLTSGRESSPTQVTLKYSNGTTTFGFVDPSPILNSNGSIILFYLPGINGGDPAQCPSSQPSCIKYIMSATEVNGSGGASFVVDSGYRASARIQQCCASDPAIFEGPSGYVLYISEGQSVVAFSSSQLQGTYAQIADLQGGVLVIQGNGGVPAGYYDPGTAKYWTYITYEPQGGTGVIRLAATGNLDFPISPQSFSTVLSGCNFKALGCSYSVESPGIYPKTH